VIKSDHGLVHDSSKLVAAIIQTFWGTTDKKQGPGHRLDLIQSILTCKTKITQKAFEHVCPYF